MREGEAGRDPTEIICRFFCVPGEGLDVARFMFAAYGTVPVYEAFFRALGWGDAIDPMVAAWRAGDRKGAVAKVPEELVREIFVLGEPAAMKERLGTSRGARHHDSGADPDRRSRSIEALAP